LFFVIHNTGSAFANIDFGATWKYLKRAGHSQPSAASPLTRYQFPSYSSLTHSISTWYPGKGVEENNSLKPFLAFGISRTRSSMIVGTPETNGSL
jgi:hypothetical protein